MKKLLYISVLFSIFLFSCGEDDVDVYPNTTLVDSAEEFRQIGLNYRDIDLVVPRARDGQIANIGAEVFAIGSPKTDSISYTFEIVSTSPEDLIDKLQVEPSGLIQAGAISGELPITTNLDNYEIGDRQSLTVKMTGADLEVSQFDEVTYTFTVICLSELAGTYNASATGQSTDGCCPDETTVTKTIVIDGIDGSYTVSDFTGGLYLEWYGPDGGNYGIMEDSDLTRPIVDVCDNISGSFADFFNGSQITVTGTVDPDTGIITYTWVNGFGDQGTVTLTPQ